MPNLHADEAFLAHYQLSHDPFAPRVPGFKFFPAQRKPVLGQLHHLARYSQLLLVVTGPHGSGKTLLRQALVASTNKQSVQSVVVSARGAGDAAGILRQIAQSLNVVQAEVRSLLAQIVQLALVGQEVYVLVDDAEQLDESALEALLALAAGTPEGRPHVFLFGEASLIPKLDNLELEEERFHVIELAPYNEEETREYLAQRLTGAGKGIELLSATQISDIHEYADGWPGNINQVARDSMIEAMLASRSGTKKAGFSLPKKHLLALSVIAVAVVAAIFMQSRPHTDATAPDSAQVAPNDAAGKPSAPASGNAPVEFANNSQPMPLPMVGKPAPVVRGNLAEQAGAEGASPEGGDDDSNAPPMPLDDEAPAQPSAPVASNQVPTPGATAKPPTVIASNTANRPATTVTATTPATPKPDLTKPKPPAGPAASASAKPAVAAAKPASTPSSVGGGSGWYTGQAASNYVLQILGTSSEPAAQSYVREQGGDYRYFKKTLQGKPLYVVTYGNFANRQAALSALGALPAKVQAGKPWPRTIASIQQDLAGH